MGNGKTPGAPKGNQNAAKAKIWSDAVRKAVIQGNNLNKLAQALVDKACDGDIAALREIGDRLEGKPVQSVEQNTNLTGKLDVEVSKRPRLTPEQWMAAHGVGTATRPTE